MVASETFCFNIYYCVPLPLSISINPHCFCLFFPLGFTFNNFFLYFAFRLSDAELCDASLWCGGVQRVSAAQKPRQEQEHGRPASWPSPGLPGYHRCGRRRLHQRGADGQLPSSGHLRGDASPAAQHHRRFLEAGVWLRLHLYRHAQPDQPVQLRLGALPSYILTIGFI